MNVSAKSIVTHMEEKLGLLRGALEREDEEALKEYATEIAAYCQLLKKAAKRSEQKGIKKEGNVLLTKRSGNDLGNILEF